MFTFSKRQQVFFELACLVKEKIRKKDFELNCLKVIKEDLIPTPDNWMQHQYWDFRNGKACFCLSGAFKFIEQNHPLIQTQPQLEWRFNKLQTRIQNLIGPEYGRSMPLFNDDKRTTHTGVLGVVVRLLPILEKEHKEARIDQIIEEIVRDAQ